MKRKALRLLELHFSRVFCIIIILFIIFYILFFTHWEDRGPEDYCCIWKWKSPVVPFCLYCYHITPTDLPEVICITNHQKFIFPFVAVAVAFLMTFTIYMHAAWIRYKFGKINPYQAQSCQKEIKHNHWPKIDRFFSNCLLGAYTLISQTMINNQQKIYHYPSQPMRSTLNLNFNCVFQLKDFNLETTVIWETGGKR